VTIVDATHTTGDAITPADPTRPATLLFHDTDLTGAAGLEAEVAHEGGDARLEIRAAGQLMADIAIPVTGDRYSWTTVTTALPTPPTGVHDLRLILHGTFRLAAFCFVPAKRA
jgi:beta-glucosidase